MSDSEWEYKKALSLVEGPLLERSIDYLVSYKEELVKMEKSLSSISPGNPLVADLVKQRSIIKQIIMGLVSCKVTHEDDIREVIDSIQSLDDESALELFDFEVYDPKEDISH